MAGCVLHRVEDIFEYDAMHLTDSIKSRVHRKKPEKSPIKPVNTPEARALQAELAVPDWRPITTEVQEGLLIVEITTEFHCNGGDLEYCLASGELRLQATRMPLKQPLRVVDSK